MVGRKVELGTDRSGDLREGRPEFRWGFVIRALGLSLSLIALTCLTGYAWLRWVSSPPEVPQEILAEEVFPEPPDQSKALRFQSSGFFLQVGERTFAVTAAHSIVNIWGRGMPDVIPIRPPGGMGPSFDLRTEGGLVGRPRLGRHLSGDYALFAVEQAVQSKWILLPDDRGSPEFRERVWLHGGVGDGSLVYGGTIYYSRSDAVWAVMEGEFNPALWSGSPFLSVETDRVVGMAVVAGHQRGRLVIGMHPIASLVEKALEAPP